MNLRLFLLLSVVSSVVLSTSWARAETSDLCDALLQIERLPVNLAEVRAGLLSPAEMLVNVSRIQSTLHNGVFEDNSSRAEIERMSSYVDGVAQSLLNLGFLTTYNQRKPTEHALLFNTRLKELIVEYKCRGSMLLEISDRNEAATAPSRSGTGIETRSSSPASTKSQQQSGADTTPLTASGSSPGPRSYADQLKSIESPIIAALVFCVIVLSAVLWHVASSKRGGSQRGCYTRGLLTFGNSCTVTYVSAIGENGAKLQAPIVNIQAKTMHLHVAGHRIEAKKDWSNKYFLGLIFPNPISPRMVADILEASRDEDQLSKIAKNATECFSPGCHLSCDRHKATQLSLKYEEKVPEAKPGLTTI